MNGRATSQQQGDWGSIGIRPLLTGIVEHESALERDFVTLVSFEDPLVVMMQQKSTITVPTTTQLKQAFGLLRGHGGLPVRFESGADPRVDLSDTGRPVMVCDGGILDALLEQRLAVVDHAAGLFRGTNCFEVQI